MRHVYLAVIFRKLHRRLHQSHEHRLRAKRAAGQLRMRLGPHKEGMLLARQLEDLHDRLGGMLAAEDQAVLFEGGDEFWIDFVAMAEAEADLGGIVEEARGQGAR